VHALGALSEAALLHYGQEQPHIRQIEAQFFSFGSDLDRLIRIAALLVSRLVVEIHLNGKELAGACTSRPY
jgi:hypothetical protein